MEKPPFTYCSSKKLKSGTREYWWFRHPKVGQRKLPGHPGTAEFDAAYERLAREAGALLVDIGRSIARPGINFQLDTHFIYFIGIEPRGPVKIGFSTNPAKRLETLQTGSPHTLRLLATLRGGSGVERILHEVLDEERMVGEWFARSKRLRSFIARIQAGTFSI